MVEWAKEKNEKRWVNLEMEMSITQLRSVIWNPPQYRALQENTHKITRNALKIWDWIHKQNKWEYNSPLISLKENYYFTPGKRSIGGNWIKKENAQLRDITNMGKINTFQD